MRIEVNAITENNTRTPDYDEGYYLIEDKGNTMIIEVEPNLEERLDFIQTQNELALAELVEVILGGML